MTDLPLRRLWHLVPVLLGVLSSTLPLRAQTPAQIPGPLTDPTALRDVARQSAQLLVFGATPAGIMAAVSSARAGEKVILLEPSYLVGGMMSGGLTKTDTGNRSTIGGLSFEFFARIERYYAKKYGPDSTQVKETHGGLFFEPHVADLVFSDMLRESGVTVLRKQQLVRASVAANRIATVQTRHYETGALTETRAEFFIDSTYEGDLMAAAQVPYRVGREASAEYGESLAGLTDVPPEYIGKGDHRLQAFNFRSTLTNRDEVRVEVPKPRYYTDAHRHFIDYVNKHGIRTFEELFHDAPLWGPVNGKSDPNKADYVGANYAYAEADYEMRALISARVRDYWVSLWWMLQNDPALSEEFKASARKWGLPKDEFVESGHVSPQMYIREARRMLGRYFLTQRDLERDRYKDDAICMGSYNIDSHDVAVFRLPSGLVKDGYIISGVDPYAIPYRSITPIAPANLLVTCAVSASHIAYGSLRMEPVFMMLGQAAGLASQIARADKVAVQDVSIEKLHAALKKAGIPHEPPFRPVVDIVGPKDGRAAVGETVKFSVHEAYVRSPLTFFWNFDGSGAVQSQDAAPSYTFYVAKTYDISLKAVDRDGNISTVARFPLVVGENGPTDIGVTVKDAALQGRWDRSGARTIENRGRVGYHDLNAGTKRDGDVKRATFTATLPRSGRYRVAFAWQEWSEASSRTPVTIEHAGGTTSITLNQRKRGTPFAFAPLGDFEFRAGEPARVIVSNEGADGYVAIDEVRWIWLGEK